MLNMGRAPCCSKVGLHRGSWTAREDKLLIQYINSHGEGRWSSLPKNAGLLRCGKSCRLRWMKHLRPNIKRGNITPDEELILWLHALLGNRWSLIAGRLPGRTDNEIKNYWNTHLSRRFKNPTTGKGTEKQSNTRKRASKPQCVPSESKKNDRGHISADDGRVEEEDTTRITSFHPGQGDQNKEQEDGWEDSPFVRFLIFMFSGLIRLAKMIGKTRFATVLKIMTWPAKILKLLQQELQL